MKPASVFLCGCAVLMGCARTPLEPPAPVSSAERARCAAIDSAFAQRPIEELPLSFAARRWRPPRPPRDLEAGKPIRTTFRVRSDGRVDTASVAVEGTRDENYRRAMVRLLSRERYVPPTMDGCPVSGQGDLQVVAFPAAVRIRR